MLPECVRRGQMGRVVDHAITIGSITMMGDLTWAAAGKRHPHDQHDKDQAVHAPGSRRRLSATARARRV